MTKIYLIRHAEAEGNLYRRIQGHWDGSITPLGLQQIDALAQRFRREHIDALYCSDLSRARATAEAITRYHDIPAVATPRLTEICMGVWEGRAWGDVEHDFPEQMRYFNTDPDRWSVPGCEPIRAVQKRMARAIEDLAARARWADDCPREPRHGYPRLSMHRAGHPEQRDGHPALWRQHIREPAARRRRAHDRGVL